MLRILAKEHNVEQKASGSVIVHGINPNQLEEHPDFGRSDGSGGEHSKAKSNGEREFLSIFSDWDWLDHLRNVWRQNPKCFRNHFLAYF